MSVTVCVSGPQPRQDHGGYEAQMSTRSRVLGRCKLSAFHDAHRRPAVELEMKDFKGAFRSWGIAAPLSTPLFLDRVVIGGTTLHDLVDGLIEMGLVLPNPDYRPPMRW